MYSNVSQGLGAHSAVSHATIQGDRPPTVTIANEVIAKLDGLTHRLAVISDCTSGLASRLMGPAPSGSNSIGSEKRASEMGLVGEIAQRLDLLNIIAEALALQVERLQVLG